MYGFLQYKKIKYVKSKGRQGGISVKSNIIIFIVALLVAFGVGYLIFNDNNETADDTGDQTESSSQEEIEEDMERPQEEEGEAVPSEAEPLANNNCLSCHAVENLGAPGGTTGPDLSNAYMDTEGKHGKPLDEFLQEPTSAVMSTVIADNPLSDEEREKIVEALKIAAER